MQSLRQLLEKTYSLCRQADDVRMLLYRLLEAPGFLTAGVSIVGRRLCIYWPDDDAWYCAEVLGYDLTENKHHVRYDDQIEEREALWNEIAHVFEPEARLRPPPPLPPPFHPPR